MKTARTKKAAREVATVVRYASMSSPIGTLYVFLTEKGICAIRRAERADEAECLDEVRGLIPKAELVHDAKALAPVLQQLRERLNGERETLDTPLDLRGSPFYLKVWQVMQQVPWGQTWSYQELARRAGRPRAVRAAASACARNPVGILVPCHRIISSDGSLGGYGGGLDMKRALLDSERARG
jgi:AraC family transcriptional regulator of adaptative response/methylated-DNA-[protein]-cysteine methyltransferase